MQFVWTYLRLGVNGLLLNEETYRQQREDSQAVQHGAALVVFIGILVGLATLGGGMLESLVTPDDDLFRQTLYDGLVAMPWYETMSESVPNFEEDFETQFHQIYDLVMMMSSRSQMGDIAAVILLPISMLLSWLVFGVILYGMARLLGGSGNLSQTLGCTALASGAHLLNLVLLVPFAQASGVFLAGALAHYIAIREAHILSPRRAFWSVVLSALLLFLPIILILVGILALLGESGL